MDLYTCLVSRLIFPIQEKLKRHETLKVRRGLDATQWWDPDRLEALRVERLRALLVEAGTHVPYYQRCFERIGFKPASLRSVADLCRLPTLSKADIRANAAALRHNHAARLTRSSTGGSSGEPLSFLIGSERVSHDVAAKWRATRWFGVDIGDPEIVLWGSPIELGTQDRLRLLRDKLMRSTLLSAFDMSDANLDRYVETIRRQRPRMLFGYPYSMAHLAQHAQRRGVPMNDLGIKVAFVTSEFLYPHQRDTIQQVFGCVVANGYGGRDAGFIAHECPAGGLHITAEDIIVETLDGNGHPVANGQAGEVTITHLATRDYPFIRYRTGDIAVLDDRQCSCGRGLPMLREVQGRTNDFLVAADGTAMPCKAFTFLLREIPGIDSFKVIQESVAQTRIVLVTSAAYDPGFEQGLVDGFRRRLGGEVRVDIEYAAALSVEKSGKFRYVLSKVDRDALGGLPRRAKPAQAESSALPPVLSA
jgi:phenylacetate-CoA ligase